MSQRRPSIRGHNFDREAFLNGALDAMWAKAPGMGQIKLLSVAERESCKNAMLAEIAGDEDIWVFGYGSLIWNPAFHYEEQRLARLHGWHRTFCFWSTLGRGTPEQPGLMMGLEPGGACRGMAYRVARAKADTELRALFMREMLAGSYVPRWKTVVSDGATVRALVFTTNRAHPMYAGHIEIERSATYIAHARGEMGHCSDYLFNLHEHLAALGIEDPMVRALHARVVEIQRVKGKECE